jgi:hypothetical protein
MSAIINGKWHRCSKCKQVKSRFEFGLRADLTCGLRSHCYTCALGYTTANRARDNGKRSREYAQAYRDRTRARLVAEAASRGGCADYGKPLPGWAGGCVSQWSDENYCFLDWDHRPGTDKKFDIGAAKTTSNWDRVKAEVDKCDAVCNPHHRLRTKARLSHR